MQHQREQDLIKSEGVCHVCPICKLEKERRIWITISGLWIVNCEVVVPTWPAIQLQAANLAAEQIKKNELFGSPTGTVAMRSGTYSQHFVCWYLQYFDILALLIYCCEIRIESARIASFQKLAKSIGFQNYSICIITEEGRPRWGSKCAGYISTAC